MTLTEEPEVLEVEPERVATALEHAKALLALEDYKILETLARAYAFVVSVVAAKRASIARLRKLLFGPKTETWDRLFGKREKSAADPESGEARDEAPAGKDGESRKGRRPKRPGHGRNGADAYAGAERREVSHETLKAGDPCETPNCKGRLSRLRPAVVLRFVGSRPIAATLWLLERFRCALCGTVFTAKLPVEAGEKKYEETAVVMIALLKYGSGLPFNRIAKLQATFAVPLAPSTQWDLVHAASKQLWPVYAELVRTAAQGDVLYNDDTTAKILELTGKRFEKRLEGGEEKGERRGVFTSGIVSVRGDRQIALFFTGRSHAGENLKTVLEERSRELSAPIQMCDGLAQSVQNEFDVLLANCLAHSRRRYVEILESFPEECRHILRVLRLVYRVEANARFFKLSAEERLELHQRRSAPFMEKLKEWLDEQIEGRKVEPNSGLGEAIGYMHKRWEKLTRFSSVPGAPLDNNTCERILKRVILHRKNAYFFKTQNGARVGDLFMSLIHTAELAGANAFEYLTALLRNTAQVAENPAAWLPWNYREALEELGARGPPG